jgi:sodium/proline symporter
MRCFVVALSAVASGRSVWLLLGVSGMAYSRGVSVIWTVIGYILAELLLFLFLAPKLRRETARLDCLTIPDYFEARFQDRSGMLRILSATIILIFMVTYVAAQFSGGGKAFHGSWGISNNWGMALTMGIVLVYTILGGFKTVSFIDMLQAICMLLALVILPVVAIFRYGGLNLMLEMLRQLDPHLIDPMALSVGALVGFLGIGLGSPGNPHILVRYMSIDDPNQLRISAIWGTVWNVLMAWGAIYVGLIGRVMYPMIDLLPGADTEQLYPLLGRNHLPPVLFGIVLASIFAAILSTADSQLLVAASAVVRDIYQKFIRKNQALSQKHLVRLSRFTILILVLLAFGLASTAQNLIFWLVLFAWGGLGASIGPPIILSLFWEHTSRWGVTAGLVAGTLVVVVWNQIPALKALVYEGVPAFLISTILVILVSLIAPQPTKKPGVH